MGSFWASSSRPGCTNCSMLPSLWLWYSDLGLGFRPWPKFIAVRIYFWGYSNRLDQTGYSNPAYDNLYAKQQTTLDFNTRKDIAWEMQKIVHDDVYIIPFYYANIKTYRSDRFTADLIRQRLNFPMSLPLLWSNQSVIKVFGCGVISAPETSSSRSVPWTEPVYY